MNNQHLRRSFLLTILSLFSLQVVFSQARTYAFEKGQVLDILLLTAQPENDSIQGVYFKEAFPIAKEFGFQLYPSFGAVRPMLLGNYQPEGLVLGTWPSLDSRLRAGHALETRLERFHQMRREIWSSFNMNYWELKEDVNFTVNPDQYNVVTAYWNQTDDEALFHQKMDQLAAARTSAGGASILILRDATSPFMYHYAPEYFTITAWPSEAEYLAFQAKRVALDQSIIKQVHQFRIK